MIKTTRTIRIFKSCKICKKENLDISSIYFKKFALCNKCYNEIKKKVLSEFDLVLTKKEFEECEQIYKQDPEIFLGDLTKYINLGD